MIPEAQYNALYLLAGGLPVEEVWAEVAQYAPGEQVQGVPVDAGNLVKAMERTPGRVHLVPGDVPALRTFGGFEVDDRCLAGVQLRDTFDSSDVNVGENRPRLNYITSTLEYGPSLRASALSFTPPNQARRPRQDCGCWRG